MGEDFLYLLYIPLKQNKEFPYLHSVMAIKLELLKGCLTFAEIIQIFSEILFNVRSSISLSNVYVLVL